MAEHPSIPDALEVEHPAPGVAVVRARGEVDLVNLAQLEQLIAEQIRRQPEQIVIDLTEVRFLASPGIAVLINAANLRPDLRLVASGPIMLRSLQMIGLDQWFNLSPTLADALAPAPERGHPAGPP